MNPRRPSQNPGLFLALIALTAGACSFFGDKKASHGKVRFYTKSALEGSADQETGNGQLDPTGSPEAQAGDPSVDQTKPAVDNTLASSLVESDYALRSDRQYLDTLVAVTGIKPTPALMQSFNQLRTAMATGRKLKDFDAGRQSATFKLAAQVCGQLSNNKALREAFYPGFDFGVGIEQVTAEQQKLAVIAATDRFWGSQNLGMDRAKAQAIALDLMAELAAKAEAPQSPASTIAVVTGVCTAIAASFQTIVL